MGICQKDTLTTQELSNYYHLIGLINTDLKDYDLVKQKSALQEQKIKGLQAISHKQQAISVRKEFQLDRYANQIIQLQTKTTILQSQLSTTQKKLRWARLENWLWRGGALVLILHSFKLFNMKEIAIFGLAVFVIACMGTPTPNPATTPASSVVTKKKRTPIPPTSGGGSGGTGSSGGNELTAPTDTELGIVGWLHFGADYEALRTQIATGTAIFWFYGKSNGQGYPTGNKNGNGYETTALSTHSITSLSGMAGIVSKCKYKIKDGSGNLIVYVEDTKGGGHPMSGRKIFLSTIFCF